MVLQCLLWRCLIYSANIWNPTLHDLLAPLFPSRWKEGLFFLRGRATCYKCAWNLHAFNYLAALHMYSRESASLPVAAL